MYININHWLLRLQGMIHDASFSFIKPFHWSLHIFCHNVQFLYLTWWLSCQFSDLFSAVSISWLPLYFGMSRLVFFAVRPTPTLQVSLTDSCRWPFFKNHHPTTPFWPHPSIMSTYNQIYLRSEVALCNMATPHNSSHVIFSGSACCRSAVAYWFGLE